MRTLFFGLMLAGVTLAAAPASADVQLTITDGRVTLSAKNATVRQILAEWSRVGQTRIINPERAGGGPITMELANVPEGRAIDTILRNVSGYLLARRATPIPSASEFDRICIVPAASAPRSAAPAAAATPTPTFPAPRQAFPRPDASQAGDQVDDGTRPVPNPQPPPFTTMPTPQPGNQNPNTAPPPGGPNTAPGAPTSYPAPTAPAGVSRPGMVVPTPQPAQPATPGTDR